MSDDRFDLVVVGGGPGGYSAAFRAADLGLRTALVESRDRLGGVCLNIGCIPSKALLHAAGLITQAAHAREIGITFGPPDIDVDRLRTTTQDVVGTLAGGLAGLAKKRKLEVVTGDGRFRSDTTLAVTTADGNERLLTFGSAIVAVGSRPVTLPGLPEDPRIMDSTGALALDGIPRHLLVIGGGIIGLEMATVYAALGATVTVVELLDQLIPGCDPDLVKPLHRRLADAGVAIHLATKVDAVQASADTLTVTLAGANATTLTCDRILVAVGRRANGDLIDADRAGVAVDERGVIAVDSAMRTNVAHILAIGDVVGNPMLAHKASHQGAIAAEVAAGLDVRFDALTIPSVAYTDPEVAWTGLTETAANAAGIAYEVAAIPWAASGRALTLGRPEGRTKLLVDPATRRVLGGGIVGANAGELIAEIVLAIELGAVAEDIALTIHPHPTLSETGGLAAEWAEGTITDLYRPPRAAAT